MAGRGVDIVLGGETPKKQDGSVAQNSPEYKKWQKEHDEVLKLGGLYVIGTERHESRRIDNQLRGRSGRQGDPGDSRFFVALDDEIMRLFGGDRIASIMTRFNMPEDVPLEHPLISKSIENAQVKVEGFNFDSRKHLVEYDDVLNKQREIIYGLRRKVLENSSPDNKKGESYSLKVDVVGRINQKITSIINLETGSNDHTESLNEKIVDDFATIIPFDEPSKGQLVKQLQQVHTADEKTEMLIKIANDLYDQREKQLGESISRQVEKFVMLSVIDNLWMNHLDAMDNLRGGIGLRGYAQKDPLVEYKNEGYRMFEQLMGGIDDEIVHRIYKIQVQNTPPEPHQHVHAVANTPESEVSTDVLTQNSGAEPKLGRNDPCWCGSGKKWKKCHYPNTQ